MPDEPLVEWTTESIMPVALADRLEHACDQLSQLLPGVEARAVRDHFAERFELLRSIASGLRALSLRCDGNCIKGIQTQQESIRSLLVSLSDGLSETLTRNRAVAENLTSQTQELDALSRLPIEQAFAERVNGVFARLRSAAVHMGDQLDSMAARLTRATACIADVERELAEARERSLYDRVTRVFSRATLDDNLQAAVRDGDAHGPWCFLLADIDRFKAVNDEFGHLVGDALLYRVARTIDEDVRAWTGAAVTARYGGEEFGIVLPRTGLSDAARVAERVRESVASKRWQLRGNAGQSVVHATVSIGVAQFRAGDTTSSLVRRADEALYAAKHAGRNRVVSETEP